MNWTDFVVIGIILGFAILGMSKGLILSIYRLASYFLSIFLAIKLYPVVAKILTGTALFGNIKEYILKNLLLQEPGLNDQAKSAAAKTVIENLKLPGLIKDILKSRIPNLNEIVNVSGIMDTVSSELTKMVIGVIALVVLYILIRVILIFTKFILASLTKLPVLKQTDKLGGFALGAIEGFLTVFIILAVLMIFSTSPKLTGIFSAIGDSAIAGYIYNHNFIVNWMFPK